jgi:hypothetical protein
LIAVILATGIDQSVNVRCSNLNSGRLSIERLRGARIVLMVNVAGLPLARRNNLAYGFIL